VSLLFFVLEDRRLAPRALTGNREQRRARPRPPRSRIALLNAENQK